MRILGADTERELATWLVRVLAQRDCQVDWVDDGRRVCRSLKATRHDAMIHDSLSPMPREHAVLRALIQRSGDPLSKRDILGRVFPDDQYVQPDVVEVLVLRRRRRLHDSAVGIRTVRGLGYVLESSG